MHNQILLNLTLMFHTSHVIGFTHVSSAHNATIVEFNLEIPEASDIIGNIHCECDEDVPHFTIHCNILHLCQICVT